jgi:hypothetical protein
MGLMGMRTMVTDFPVVRYPINAYYSKFPSIAWIPWAFKNISSSFLTGEAKL